MNSIGFKGKESEFFTRVQRAKKSKGGNPNTAIVEQVRLTVPAVRLICLDATSIHSDQDDTTCLIMYSNHERFQKRDGKHKNLERIIDRIQNELDQEVRSLLGYHVKGGLRKKWIHNHEHRALFVGEELRGRGGGQFLYDTMSKIEGIPTKETTYVPSLLTFHIKQGFEVSKIHIPVGDKKMAPMYDLNQTQKNLVTQLIFWAKEQGDLSLPFFVELKNTGNVSDVQADFDTDRFGDLISLINVIQAQDSSGYRLFEFMSKLGQQSIEQSLDLESQGDGWKTRLLGLLIGNHRL